MVSVIIFVLLLNLTYNIQAQGIPPEQIFQEPISLDVDNNSKLKNSNASSKQPSANKLVDQQHNTVSHVQIPNNPFPGKDAHNVNHRQLEKAIEVIDQSQKKSNNVNEVVIPNTEQVKDSQNKPTARNSSTNPSKEVKIDNTTSENKTSTVNPIRLNTKNASMQSGPLIRGFYVFLGLSVITMMYFIFRSYRLRHGSQPSTTVRKYGITARRSDMEMRPLELDDDDDDTVFEIGNQNANQ